MEEARARELLAEARAARFATLTADGRPHLVAITFALDGDTIYHAVDHKPKATRRLARVANVERDPRASLLADHYDDDWSQLWWVRVDGRARVLDEMASPEASRALDLLADRYDQYRDHRPAGPVIALDIEHLTGWSARKNGV